MDKVGKYEIKQTLLKTGFSDIYIGYDPDLQINVAVKVFHPKGDNIGEKATYGPDFWRERFIEEPKVLAGLDHPNIINVLYMDKTDDGDPYFVMSFIEANLIYEIGEDADTKEKIAELEPFWRPKSVAPRRAFDVWRQILSALAAMHDQGLVHRDIKPPNILLTSKKNGRVKLCDFGMVKVPGAKGSRSGVWIGTLDYISPEQRRSAKEVTAAADVYSAAALLYRMLTGRLAKGIRAPLRAGRFGLSDEVVGLIESCLKKRAADRPQTAGDVLKAFDKYIPDINALPNISKVARRAAATRVITKKIS
ncbi:serine/threonine protein kinase [Rhodospirillales bacterium]|nr:serine/threonine protein kinase [Rhodospirillales bacterium]